eukprot:4738642-Prymnesium_polylepis.1
MPTLSAASAAAARARSSSRREPSFAIEPLVADALAVADDGTQVREVVDLRLALALAVDEVIPKDGCRGARERTLWTLRRIEGVDGDAVSRRD